MQTKIIIYLLIAFCIGFFVAYGSLELQCELNKADVNHCVSQANQLLNIVLEKEYCNKEPGIAHYNFSQYFDTNST